MPKTALDIAAVLLLILPGFLVYRFAITRRADPAARSILWQTAEILQYSVYVHIVGVGLLFGLLFVLGHFGVESHLKELPGKSPDKFLEKHFIEGTLLFTLYPVYVVLSATIMGAYDTPNWIANLIERTTAFIARRIPWIRPPQPAYSQQPIWYDAFHTMPRRSGRNPALIRLLVKMKQGDIYDGFLESYPILPDEQREKDLLLKWTWYYQDGNLNNARLLSVRDGIGAVLLNTAEVESIQVRYTR